MSRGKIPSGGRRAWTDASQQGAMQTFPRARHLERTSATPGNATPSWQQAPPAAGTGCTMVLVIRCRACKIASMLAEPGAWGAGPGCVGPARQGSCRNSGCTGSPQENGILVSGFLACLLGQPVQASERSPVVLGRSQIPTSDPEHLGGEEATQSSEKTGLMGGISPPPQNTLSIGHPHPACEPLLPPAGEQGERTLVAGSRSGPWGALELGIGFWWVGGQEGPS